MEQIPRNGTPYGAHGEKPVPPPKNKDPLLPKGSHRLDWPIWVLMATAIGFTLHNAAFFFIWITSAFMLFALVDPSVQKLSRRGISPTVSALVLIAILCAGLGALGALLYFSVEGVSRDLDLYRDALSKIFRSLHQDILRWSRLASPLLDGGTRPAPATPSASAGTAGSDFLEFSGKIGSTVLHGLANAVSVISFLFLTPLLTFFLILERDILSRAIVDTYRLEPHEIVRLWRGITAAAGGFFFGNVILLALSLPVFVLLFFAFDVTSPLQLALIASLLNLIPFVGAVTAGFFPSLNVLIHGGTLASATALYLLCIIFHFFFANVVTPKAIGDRLDLNATTSLIAAIGVGELWGVAGLILGIPLLAIVKVLMEFSRSPEARWLAALMSNKASRALNREH